MNSAYSSLTKLKETLVSSNSYETSTSSQIINKKKFGSKSKIGSLLKVIEDKEFFENYKYLIDDKELIGGLYQPIEEENFVIREMNPLVRINLLHEIDNKEEISVIHLKISENTTISNMVKIAVDKYNDYFFENSLSFKFVCNYDEYDVRPSKKTGHPKLDLPCIQNDVFVKQTCIDNFSLIYKKKNLKKVTEKKNLCRECFIF